MTDQDYINNYKESRYKVNRFANIAQNSNINVMLKPQPSLDVREPDDGDMMVLARIEHKARSLDFTSREDYPFSTVIIDETYKIDSKKDKVLMYVIENREGTHAAVVYGFTKSLWKVKEKYDTQRERMCKNYEVDKNMVRFCKVEEVF